MDVIRRCAMSRCGGIFALVAAVLCLASSARAVTPSSPEVKELIAKGVEYLEKNDDGRLGGRCLIAMTLLKAGKPVAHPKVQAVLADCQRLAKAGDAKVLGEDIYSLGIEVLFLCEADPVEYAAEIQFFLKALELRQKSHGGWGYEEQKTGDTSMTQYGVLSAWTARQAGFAVPDKLVEDVANWLIRTQDPSGGWGYQGVDPGTFDRVAQSEVRLSLTTAALGSSLIAGNLLGMIDLADDMGNDDDLPPALIPVQEEQAANPNANPNVESRRLRGAVSAGAGWFQKNYRIDPDGFTHYYMYALERYMSFKELAEGRRGNEAKWYNDGYEFLKKTQQNDGSWASAAQAPVDTAFAVLFLLRSTKKSIEKSMSFGDGTLVGGRGLPKDTADIKLRGGRLIAKNQAQAVEDMLKALGDPDDPDLDFMAENPEEIELSENEKERTKQLKQLRQVVRGGAPKARLAAVRALGRSRDSQYVPLLIFALTDPDPQVAVAADEALRVMSRKLDAVTMKIPPDKAAREVAVERWTAWYKKINPDLALEN